MAYSIPALSLAWTQPDIVSIRAFPLPFPGNRKPVPCRLPARQVLLLPYSHTFPVASMQRLKFGSLAAL